MLFRRDIPEGALWQHSTWVGFMLPYIALGEETTWRIGNAGVLNLWSLCHREVSPGIIGFDVVRTARDCSDCKLVSPYSLNEVDLYRIESMVRLFHASHGIGLRPFCGRLYRKGMDDVRGGLLQEGRRA